MSALEARDTRLLERMYKIYDEKGLLLSLHIDITYRCTMRCPHCYLEGLRSSTPELSSEEWIHTLREAMSLKAFKLTISGGEPMIREDIWAILEEAHRLHFRVRLKTTGIYLDKSSIERIARFGNITVDISVHGAKPETHDRFVGIQGAYIKAISAIQGLRDNDVPIRVTMSATNINIEEASEVKEKFTRMGILCDISAILHYTKRHTYLDCLLASQEQRAKVGYLDGRVLVQRDLDSPLCRAGRTHLYVCPDGTIYPCVAWPQNLGNLRSSRLEEILNMDTCKEIKRLKVSNRTDCLKCDAFQFCNFCPGQSWIEKRNPILPNRPSCDSGFAMKEGFSKWSHQI